MARKHRATPPTHDALTPHEHWDAIRAGRTLVIEIAQQLADSIHLGIFAPSTMDNVRIPIHIPDLSHEQRRSVRAFLTTVIGYIQEASQDPRLE